MWKWNPGCDCPSRRRLIEDHDVRETAFPTGCRSVAALPAATERAPAARQREGHDRLMAFAGGDERFVRPPRRNTARTRDRFVACFEQPASVFDLGANRVLEQRSAGVDMMSRGDARLIEDRLEREVRRIDLAIRMRARDTDEVASVLEDEDVLDAGERAQLFGLCLPDSEERIEFIVVEIAQ